MSTALPQVRLTEGVLVVTGEVGPGNVVELRRQGEKLIAAASGTLTVDLEGVDTAHSVVLSLLLCWRRLAGRYGVTLVFRGISSRLASLAALSNLDDELTRAS